MQYTIGDLAQYLTKEYEYGDNNNFTMPDIQVILDNRKTIADKLQEFYELINTPTQDTGEDFRNKILAKRKEIGEVTLYENDVS